MIEAQKKAFYAAVGAPVAVGKKLSDRINERLAEANTKLDETRERISKEARSEFEEWAKEGERMLGRLQDRKVVEDLANRMDVDQFQEQVGKLRGQLEDMLETWRANFLPERAEEVKAAEKVTVEVKETVTKTSPKTAAKKPAARKPAAKTAAARKPAAKKPAAKKPAAKKPAARTTAKKPATKATAKSTAAKTTAARKPAAKTAKAAAK